MYSTAVPLFLMAAKEKASYPRVRFAPSSQFSAAWLTVVVVMDSLHPFANRSALPRGLDAHELHCRFPAFKFRERHVAQTFTPYFQNGRN